MKIVESGGSSPGTKQFVWCGKQPGEVRDATGAVTAQYFSRGEIITGISYFSTKDHLGSVREMTNAGGTIVNQQSFDPYGVPASIVSTIACDIGYSGCYVHARSGLLLTRERAYNAVLGRFINRDPIEEAGGLNLYDYVGNSPINWLDADGLGRLAWNGPEPGGAGGINYGPGPGIGPAIPGITFPPIQWPPVQWPPSLSPPDWWKPPYKPPTHCNAKPPKNPPAELPPAPPIPADPTQPPGPDWEWRGQPGSRPGVDPGGWYNPGTGESLSPDLNNPAHDPHWDYIDPQGQKWRWPAPGIYGPPQPVYR